MSKVKKRAGVEFAMDSNVHIEVVSPQNVIKQTVDKHNKATQQLVSGLLRFIRGEFNVSNKQTNKESIIYGDQAKYYIPCYIGVGTAGIKLTTKEIDGIVVTLPDYNELNRRIPPIGTIIIDGVEQSWSSENNRVNYTDKTLKKEVQGKSRYPIGVMQEEEHDNYATSVGDIQQIVFATDISPGYYKDIYDGVITDIFITEIGLFSNNDPEGKDLLARVIFKNEDTILYVRPQDTIIVRWTISIIALNDYSEVDEEATVTTDEGDITLHVGQVIDDKANFNGTISEDEGDLI